MAALRPAEKLATVLRVSCPTEGFARRPLGLLILADHRYSAIHIEAGVTASLAYPVPPFLRMALRVDVHAAVFAPIFPSTGVRTEAATPAAKSASKPKNQRIQCSARSLPANGNRRPPAPGAFRPGPRGFGGLFELRHDLLSGHNQLGHHGCVKNALALRRRRKLLRSALRIPLPWQRLVPARDLCK